MAAVTVLTRRKMQEELQLLWEELRFTLLFVTHSIEEALVVGNRIGLLVENGVFGTLERVTVQRWGMQR